MVTFNEVFDNIQLKELSDEEHSHVANKDWIPSELKDWLILKGLHLIGSGHYSEVWGKNDTNKIVKINRQPDPSYRAFITYAQKNPSTYFPKIYDIKELKGNEEDLFLFITEKLNPVSQEFYSKTKRKYYDFYCFLESIKYGAFRRLEVTKQVDSLFQEKYRKLQASGSGLLPFDKWKQKEIKETGEAFSQTHDGTLIKEVFRMGHYDLHYDNVMVRPGTNDIVMTDPIS